MGGSKEDLIKRVAAASAFINSISMHVGPDHSEMFDDDIRREMVSELGERWLSRHARDIFPGVDELEIEEGWVVKHDDHDEHEGHKMITLQQLLSWVDRQQPSLF